MQNNFSSKREPLLVVISGPSGAGKDSVLKRMKERRLPFYFVVTVTTRPARTDEQHSVDYFFISHEEFKTMIEKDELLEYALVYDESKGVTKAQIRQALASGKDIVMRVDVQGAATIRRLSPGALLIFLTTEDEEDMIKRLKLRKTESPAELKLRIETTRAEMRRIHEFDYVVVNRESHLDDTVDIILAIMQAEHHRVMPRKVTL